MSNSSDPKQNPLSLGIREVLYAVRGLDNYHISYAEPRYPALSFIYAIYAGGEQTIYCDFFEDYAYEYLIKPFGISREAFKEGGAAFQCQLPPYMRPFLDALHSIFVRSEGGTKHTVPTPDETKAFAETIRFELSKDPGRSPKW